MNISNDVDVTWLDPWVQPMHTTDDALRANRAAFAESGIRLLALRDFLRPAVAARTAEFLASEARYEEQFFVYQAGAAERAHTNGEHHERKVDEQEWLTTPADQRFLRFSVGPGQPASVSPGWMRYFALHSAIRDDRFRAFIESTTGLALGPVSSISVHSMRAGDMLGAHSDVTAQRKLAFILYLTSGWKPAYGGQLTITSRDGAVITIEPEYNTFVMFDVESHKSHRVQMIDAAAGTARRISLSGWFDYPAHA